jgi:hypothetical protein
MLLTAARRESAGNLGNLTSSAEWLTVDANDASPCGAVRCRTFLRKCAE